MSWSGERSHRVAKLLGDWLGDVIQAVKPWISSSGIDRGEQWFRKIGDKLSEINVGIVCLTPENKENPWIMFEAGALLKGSADARVMTFLIDLKNTDVTDPLAQFNHTTASKSDMLELVTSLNARLGEAALPVQRLQGVFETYWPQFETKYNEIMETSKRVVTVVDSVVPAFHERSANEMISEVLETVRGIKQQMRPSTQTYSTSENSSTLSEFIAKHGMSPPRTGLINSVSHGAMLREFDRYILDGLKNVNSLALLINMAPASGFRVTEELKTRAEVLYEIYKGYMAKDPSDSLTDSSGDPGN
ncbi:MAG: hypothetical protein V4723_10755 [Pseudomonadota bacterium]